MLKATKAVAAAAGVMGVLAAGAVFADSAVTAKLGSHYEIMMPGRGLSLDVGDKRAVGYFQTRDEACYLTIVVADAAGGETGQDSPGTRFVAPVAPGRNVQLDTSAGRSAEFLCGPGGTRMSARVFNRTPYKSS